MRFLKITLKVLGGLGVFLAVVLVATVTTLDYTPYQEMDYYRDWKNQISKVGFGTDTSAQAVQAGWAKVNFTPENPVPMAGYGNRRGKSYESVHDSVFVRAIYLDNGLQKVVLLVADLLIIPPTVTDAFKARLPELGLSFDQVYMSATHSHNSIGGWGNTITGELFSGTYDPVVEAHIADAMVEAIKQAQQKAQPVEVGYMEAKDTVDIKNRLKGLENTTVDPWVRNIKLTAADGTTALLSTYAAHATVLDSRTYELSRDYAGALVDSLEDGEVDFALFMAGAVGSMGPMEIGPTEFEQVGHQADGVEAAIEEKIAGIKSQPVHILRTAMVLLPLRQPSPRLNQTFVLRPWVFRWAFGDYPSFVKATQIGDILMVGLPCDFSGELVAELTSYASAKGLHLIITSFNGAYAGYITEDRHFDKDQYETVTMSWFGPYNGAYFQEVVKDVIDKFAI